MRKKLCIFLLITMLVLSGCSNKDSDNNEKIEAEIEYIDKKIFSLADKLNNVSSRDYEITSKETEMKKEESSSSGGGEETQGKQSSEGAEKEEEGKSVSTTEIKETSILESKSDESEIDWQNMKIEIENINNVWNVISIDLKNEKIADNEIEEFNDILNQTIISIKNENKDTSLKNIAQLYSFIPTFMNYTSMETNKKIVKTTKSELIKAYSEASLENWENVSTHIVNAQNTFFSISNNNQKGNNEFKIEKAEHLMQNLNSSVSLKDLQVFMLHYKSLIQNLDTI